MVLTRMKGLACKIACVIYLLALPGAFSLQSSCRLAGKVENVLSARSFNGPFPVSNRDTMRSLSSMSRQSNQKINRLSSLSMSSSNVIEKSSKTLDVTAIASYLAATTIEISLTSGFLYLVQTYIINYLPQLGIIPSAFLPAARIAITAGVFFFLSLRQRVFSPLDNSRPAATAEDPVFKQRLRPSWQPAPIVFPIVWTTIAFLRTISGVMIFQSTNTLLSMATLAFVAHIAVGDTWNTINNVENRLGTSVVGVGLVWLSLANALKEYYLVNPIASYVLAPSFLWISIASVLIYSIWQLNYEKFNAPSLFPSKEEGPPSAWRFPLTSWDK